MENFDHTISIGQLVEQLTLNQWALGSSPRWCTQKSTVECAKHLLRFLLCIGLTTF